MQDYSHVKQILTRMDVVQEQGQNRGGINNEKKCAVGGTQANEELHSKDVRPSLRVEVSNPIRV